jgi:glycosyltransferase involved in cell wall biosynthesis
MDPRLKVLVTADAVGGVWQYSIDLARGLSALDIEVVVALMGPSPSEQQLGSLADLPGLKLIDTGLPLDWLAEDASSIAAAGEGIAALAAKLDADLVHLNMPALAATADFSVPVVAVQHSCVATWWEAVHGTDLPKDFAWRTGLVSRGLARADVVVTPSSAFGEATRRRYGLVRSPEIVHNGRTPLKLPEAAPHDFVFTAGRLWDEAKNLKTLDGAAGRIGVPVHVAGPVRGPNGTAALFDNLHCLGTLSEEELGRWLAARPVFVSAALYEPFGLAVLEAAAAGCPLILSDIPTFRELWGNVAIFVDPRDERGFSDAIATLVGDDFQRGLMGRAAKERASLFTPAAMAAQMADIYRKLVPALQRPVLQAKAAA